MSWICESAGLPDREPVAPFEETVVSPFDRLRPGMRKSLAFTLVELLVVVAIIALLISIMLPSLSRAKAIARMVKCSTNQYAIGRAAHMYAAAYNDFVPRDSGWSNPPHTAWLFFGARFSPYLGGPTIPFEHDSDDAYLYEAFKDIGAYKCPSFVMRYPEYVLTYLPNGYNFKDPTQWGSPMTKVSKMPYAPASVGYICEMNHEYLLSGPSVGYPDGPEVFGRYDFLGTRDSSGTLVENSATFHENGSPNMFSRMIRFDDDRHNGKTTIVFFDGHAETRSLTSDEMPIRLFFPNY